MQYHQRALVLHENLHMLTMICHGTGGTEGPTYAGEQHVYDPTKRQLTVACFDKAPLLNYTDTGLDSLQQRFVPIIDVARRHWRGGDAVGAVYQQFLWTDPDRLMKWRIWRDEFYQGRVDDASLVARLSAIYGPLDEFDDAWAKWILARRASFHHVDWGWEQDGAALWAYGFPWNKQFWSQLNLRYPPGETVGVDPLRMDYPAPSRPAIVGPVRRGPGEPTIGFVIGGLDARAWGGCGLGVEDRTMCQAILIGNRSLVVDGTSMGMTRRVFPLRESVREAARAAGNRFGVTLTIRAQTLEVVVRAGDDETLEEQTESVPLDEPQRRRLLEKPLALIGKDGYPRITPWIDDGRRPSTNLRVAAPANRWTFAGLERLETLYRAAWRLGGDAPPSLRALRQDLLQAVDAVPERQAAAVEAYDQRIAAVADEVLNCGASEATRQRALADLAGIYLQLQAPAAGATIDAAKLSVHATRRLTDAVRCRYSALARAGDVTLAESPAAEWSEPSWFRPQVYAAELPRLAGHGAVEVRSRVEGEWRGKRFVVEFSQATGDVGIGEWLLLGPFDDRGPKEAAERREANVRRVETEEFAADRAYEGVGGECRWRRVGRAAEASVVAEQVIDFQEFFGRRVGVVAYALAWIDAEEACEATLSLGSDDGVIVRLNGREVHRNLVQRGYSSQSDRAPLRLNRGRNTLLVQVTQGDGDWKFGARLLDAEGRPPRGVKTTISP